MKVTTSNALNRVTSAIEALFSDTSVTPAETLEALEEIHSDVEGKIDALKSENEL